MTRYLTIVDQHGRNIPESMIYSGGYEGSSTGRRLASWGLSSFGPNSALLNSLPSLRSRQRELVRNHPLAGGGVDTIVSNMIGSGITPRWQVDDPELKERIQELWADSVVEMDADGVCDFYGLQDLVARTMCNGGEAIALLHYRSPYEGLAVPLQVQVLEGDHLDEVYNGIAPNGNEIRMGIEFDSRGRRTAYWLYQRHPQEQFATLRSLENRRVRVPASQVLHVYRPLRAGQIRGLPWFASIILKLHEIDQCVDAELVRRKTTAMFGGFIKRELPMDGSFASGRLLGRSTGSDDQVVIELEPGTFPELPPGTDVKFAQPTDVSGNYVAWMQQQLRDIARGMGITYEQLTGDLTDVNYSSIRAGLLEFRRLITQVQAMTVIYQFCRPIVNQWLDAAVLSGALEIPDYYANRRRYRRVKWMPDGWDWVDPEKDLKAAIMEIRAGLTSRTRAIARRQGADAEVIDREIAADNQRADSLGLVLDSDPRRTSLAGKFQETEEADK